MPSAAFGPADYQVFDVKGFEPRMAQLRTRVRPKLEALGRSLAPALARSVGGETFAHIPCLNDSSEGMAVLEKVVRRELSGWI